MYNLSFPYQFDRHGRTAGVDLDEHIRDLIEQGLITPPYWIQTVMGYQTSSFPTVQNVIDLLR